MQDKELIFAVFVDSTCGCQQRKIMEVSCVVIYPLQDAHGTITGLGVSKMNSPGWIYDVLN